MQVRNETFVSPVQFLADLGKARAALQTEFRICLPRFVDMFVFTTFMSSNNFH